jgi:hypothetical protein
MSRPIRILFTVIDWTAAMAWLHALFMAMFVALLPALILYKGDSVLQILYIDVGLLTPWIIKEVIMGLKYRNVFWREFVKWEKR